MDLWPDLHELSNIKGPKEILEEQGDWLAKKTNDMLYLAITESTDLFDVISNEFIFNVQLGGKYLEKYSYRLLQFRHGITMYPVFIKIDEDIDYIQGVETSVTNDNVEYKIVNQEQFEEFFRALVNTSQVKGVVSAILSLSR